MNVEEYGRIIDEACFEKDGRKRLTCAKAFELSGKYGIPVRKIGNYCTKAGIRISNCQLGCFK